MPHDNMEEYRAQTLVRFGTTGMPARNLALRTRREYMRNLQDFLADLER